MSQAGGTNQISAGDDVISADGEKVGTVAAIHPSYLLVEKGVLFVTDYHVPFGAIDRHDADAGAVYLNVTRDDALNSGWDKHAADTETGDVETLLTGAASMPYAGETIDVVEADEAPLQEREAEID